MKKLLLVSVSALSLAYAKIEIALEDEISFRNASGTLTANITYDNQKMQGIGTYRVNNKKVIFSIDRLSQNGRLFTLKQPPSIVRQLKSENAKLPKGSLITLKGENPNEFKEFATILQNDAKGESNNQAAKKAQQSQQSSNSQGSQGSSVGNISVGGQTPSGQIPYLPISSSTTGDDGTQTDSKWSAQYCKVPEFLENQIKLSIVDKDGNCVEKMAVRDDTKCEYRFDFVNSKAIKQTQFYYVDNENKVQTVGDCVDLVGDEYRVDLYKDDTRCELETTDKDYGGGKGSFFVTQILFRGIDGLIHEATDCIAYGNIKEELVDYEKNDKTKKARRIVNQYYIDPYTKEQHYITKGVKTDAEFDYVEKACGDWEMDDVLLQGKKRTEITFYDQVDYKEVPVTSCDFSVQGGKKSEYIMKYQDLSSTYKEKEISREPPKDFNIKKVQIQKRTDKHKWQCGFKKCYNYCDRYWQDALGTTSWTTTYVLKDVTSYKVYLRPDGSEYKKNQDPSGTTFKKIFRETIIKQNDFNLDQDYLKYYEVNEGFYKDEQTKLSKEFNEWITNNYQKDYACEEAHTTMGDLSVCNSSSSGQGYCTKPLNYKIP